jgi:hypothetical protein
MGCGCKGKKEETVQPAIIKPEPIKLPAEPDKEENINQPNNGQ